MVFIGPPAEIISLAGDKEQSKRVMASAGVPVIPGSAILPDVDAALTAAQAIGYPVLSKRAPAAAAVASVWLNPRRP